MRDSRLRAWTRRTTIAACCAAGAGTAAAQSAPKPNAPSLERLNDDLRALSEFVSPSVVQVVAAGYSTTGEGKVGAISRERSSGSGIVLSAEGHIVTNAHVVEGATSIHVLLRPAAPASRVRGSILGPRSLRLPAQLVGLDRETDVAVIKVEGLPLPP